jgi:hypothetical protein
MGYINNYTYDIFISYSHIDNEKFLTQTKGWIEEFYNDLTVALWQSIGTKDVKIWWDDKRLDGATFFDEAISDAIENSAILLCLNSPAYLKSSYCKTELVLFYNYIQTQSPGLRIGNHSRILNALLNNIPFETWPKELIGTTGFHFHDAVNLNARGHRLDTKSARYAEKLQQLVDAIVELMDEFPKQEKIEEREKKFTIFFADVADTLTAIRKRTITELQKEDFNIVYNVPPPYEENEHEQTVKDKIREADLTIHLLDQYPGREINAGGSLWYPQKQAELCLSTDKAQLIWVPKELDIGQIEEQEFKIFMESLKNGEQFSKQNVEYIEGIRSELTKQIKDFAGEIKGKKPGKISGEKISVLLDTHYNDQLYALEMSKSFLENNIQPYINPQDDDPLQNIKVLEDRISQVKGLIFFYGKVAGDWVSERMKAARQFIVLNDYPIEEFYVYLLPPHKDPNDKSLKQRFIKVNVLNNSDMSQLDIITLKQLLENIKACHE